MTYYTDVIYNHIFPVTAILTLEDILNLKSIHDLCSLLTVSDIAYLSSNPHDFVINYQVTTARVYSHGDEFCKLACIVNDVIRGNRRTRENATNIDFS